MRTLQSSCFSFSSCICCQRVSELRWIAPSDHPRRRLDRAVAWLARGMVKTSNTEYTTCIEERLVGTDFNTERLPQFQLVVFVLDEL